MSLQISWSICSWSILGVIFTLTKNESKTKFCLKICATCRRSGLLKIGINCWYYVVAADIRRKLFVPVTEQLLFICFTSTPFHVEVFLFLTPACLIHLPFQACQFEIKEEISMLFYHQVSPTYTTKFKQYLEDMWLQWLHQISQWKAKFKLEFKQVLKRSIFWPQKWGQLTSESLQNELIDFSCIPAFYWDYQ